MEVIFRSISILFIIISIFSGTQSDAEDWPHWRGPFLNGSCNEKNLPVKWSLSENTAWVAELPGPGSATPIIIDGKVFISSMDKNSNALFGFCFDAGSGKELWRKKLGESNRNVPRNNLATPSAVAGGGHVYFIFGSGDFAGLDYEGNLLFSRNLEEEYGNISQKFGYSSSPLLHENRLYILVQRRHTAYRAPRDTGLDSFILALNAGTGENIWKQPRETKAKDETLDSYSSPILYQNSERSELLVVGASCVTSNDLNTGAELWRYEYPEQREGMDRNISSPVTGEGLIFAVPPRGDLGLLAIKSDGRGVLSKDNIAWMFNGPSPDCSTPLYYKGNIYILADRTDGILTCLDAKTGRQKWQGKLGGSSPWWASVTAGDDKLYCISEAAEVVVLAANDEEFKILSRIEMEDKPVQASIAIADGCLFIHTANKLYCIGNQ
ncbi:MAG: PQQ-binding-like beta-propeller repeat protein [Sedimentisphaerales bacterium]|nr:PQQ-binding-like beta-propeller repeat protein [Sedimentisphaerales bacterium]